MTLTEHDMEIFHIHSMELGYSLEGSFLGQEFKNGDDVLRVKENGVWVEWILCEYESTGADSRQYYNIIAKGEGTSANLREPRHTYIGDNGYIFYINPKILNWGFKLLERWFDFK